MKPALPLPLSLARLALAGCATDPALTGTPARAGRTRSLTEEKNFT